MWDECNCSIVSFMAQLTKNPCGSAGKNLSAVWETWVRALHWEDPLEKEMTVHSSTIASKIPWTEEPGRLQSMGSQRVGHNWATSLSLSHANKVIHRILQARLQQCRTENFQMYKLGFEEAEESEIKLPTSIGSLKKQESSRKTTTSASLTLVKPLAVWITTNCGKFLKWWEYQTTLSVSWETFMQVKKQQLKTDMEQLTVSIWGRNMRWLHIVTLLI